MIVGEYKLSKDNGDSLEIEDLEEEQEDETEEDPEEDPANVIFVDGKGCC